MLTRLLDLGRERGKLAEKHRRRLQLALVLPTIQMDLDTLMANRVDSWLERRTSTNEKVSYHANKSLHNITCLHEDHPLRKELNSRTPSLRESLEARKSKSWADLLSASRGAANNSGKRQILAQSIVVNIGTENKVVGESILYDGDVAQEVKKTALRWTIYRFPVNYVPTEAEDNLLKQVPSWAHQPEEGKKNIKEALFNVYNSEQKCWKRRTIRHAGVVT